ncbi:MAG TPA: hypothetical protein VIR38_05355, partial [Thalassobaculum sp.]
MRCLWLTWVDPVPEHDGQRIYSGQLIRSTAAAGAEVHVLCAADARSHRRDGDREEQVTWGLVRHEFPPAWASIASPLPRIAHRSGVAAMRRRLAATLAQKPWDCIVFDGIGSG